MKTSIIAFAALLAASHVYGASDSPTRVSRGEHGTKVIRQAKGVQKPSTFPIPNAPTSHGCYGSAGNMTLHKTVENMSSGSCNEACKADNFWVSGLHGPQCFCGYSYPSDKDVVADNNCNYPCPSYDLEACGGLGKPGFWSVFNTGVNVEAVAYEGSSTSSGSANPTSSHSGGQSSGPAVVTQTEAPSDPSDSKSGPNTAGIAAGVVVGVVGAAAIVGGIFFFMRRKRNAEIEEEHRRNAAVNAFINGSKPPGSSGSISMTDARLDPVLAHRRMSDGSIADNEDYSRRILRVTNA
ncbi:Uncharacterized protein TCAP_05192 [Tolypocladium capitatum]|uniref:WSC domain-containing protein n=1 Tax=Tolypocladium capitatum TaxID=45235 RepID=A0A2K3QBD0_9HYPO|nr:Uncharacterized protein TCAP_05192 [Tolypocladium capitatum]